jgi:hypothetical protein
MLTKPSAARPEIFHSGQKSEKKFIPPEEWPQPVTDAFRFI